MAEKWENISGNSISKITIGTYLKKIGFTKKNDHYYIKNVMKKNEQNTKKRYHKRMPRTQSFQMSVAQMTTKNQLMHTDLKEKEFTQKKVVIERLGSALLVLSTKTIYKQLSFLMVIVIGLFLRFILSEYYYQL